MKRLILLLCAIITFSCNSDIKKVTKAEMEAYEKELKEKINVVKVEIVQMKLDLEEMSDSLSNDYVNKLDDFEKRLNSAEESYNSFKNETVKEIWKEEKAKMDSVIGYLELQIDSTKVNIEQIVNN